MLIGLLHPGDMGTALGRLLRERGHEVLWASSGRGPATVERARVAGFSDVDSVAALARSADVILSVCPPSAAVDVARSVTGYRGVFVDANAVAPDTARQIADGLVAGGGRCLDGGIIGPPPTEPGSTRLYVAGAEAEVVLALFHGTVLDVRVVPGGVGAASALKVCYAAWTKGTAALLLATRALARAELVEPALLEEWSVSFPDLTDRSRTAARSAAGKGWRWVGEMEEIAAAFAASDLPPGFHEAAAEVFRRAPRSPDPEPLDEVLNALAGA